MGYQWYDFVGNIGVAMILLAYLMLQLEKMDNTSIIFSCLNASGALLILVSLVFDFNLSAFFIEFFWLLISLIGIAKYLRAASVKRRGAEHN